MRTKFIVGVLMVLLASACSQEAKKEKTSRVTVLPYYDEATYTPQWYDSEDLLPDDFHSISDFSLIDQNAQPFTQHDVAGKVYVVDFFFTVCPGICPKMTANMSKIQEAFIDDEEVVLLSHSVTPEFDSATVLKKYAASKGVVDGKWFLLTGDRAQIYDLGRNQYFVEENLGLVKSEEDFLHTENFVLIDQNRHIRGIYNGLNKSALSQLVADVKTLTKKG